MLRLLSVNCLLDLHNIRSAVSERPGHVRHQLWELQRFLIISCALPASGCQPVCFTVDLRQLKDAMVLRVAENGSSGRVEVDDDVRIGISH